MLQSRMLGGGRTPQRPEDPAEGPYRRFIRFFKRFSFTDELTDDRIREARRAYYANVTLIDQAVGRIVEALGRSGHSDDT